jgi:probable F420-dependent oxidoreductase
MKIRIGIALGSPAGFGAAVDRLEANGIDSLWLSEMVYGELIDPMAGMAWALARTERLKVGTGVMVLPGRHPVLVAKQIASLTALAPGRVLPVFGLKPARPAELPLFGVPQGRRAAIFDESVELVKLLLSRERVSYSGEFFTVREATVGQPPAKPVDIWLGGTAPGALRRVGRLADGWLASFLTPAEARAGREAIERSAAEAGREIEPDHFGISLAVGRDGIPAALAEIVRQRRPGVDPADMCAGDWAAARRLIDAYVAAGLTKFVIRPAGQPADSRFIDEFASEMLPLQT